MSRGERKAMITRDAPDLSLSRQCRLLSISRSSFYYAPKGESPENLALMRRIDELFMKHPFYGSRQMVRQLRRDGVCVGRHRVRRMMRLMGLEAIYQAPRTSRPHPTHRIYPYLLKGLAIDRPNRVWCADITYIPVQHGFLYLVAIMALRRPQARAVPTEIGGDEPDTGEQLAGVPLHLGHDAADSVLALGLLAEAGVVAPYIIWRTANRSREQVRDAFPQHSISRKADRVQEVRATTARSRSGTRSAATSDHDPSRPDAHRPA